jgi:MoxR-like ATPase
MKKKDWLIYRGGEGDPAARYREMLADREQCPGWRDFSHHFPTAEERQGAIERTGTVPDDQDKRGATFVPSEEMIQMVNAALYLRRPLLVMGEPGVGKSTLIYSVARELKLGPVLRWGINSRSTRQEGLYQYDAIGRLQAWQLQQKQEQPEGVDIGDYLTLGPVGTALLPYETPRALLIDEIDKGDPDLANDLLDLLEEGQFRIPELARLKKRFPSIEVPTADGDRHRATIEEGEVRCLHFPVVILTSNGEREFSRAFQRRCLHLEVTEPAGRGEEAKNHWNRILGKHLPAVHLAEIEQIVDDFIKRRQDGGQTTDQLMQAVFLLSRDFSVGPEESQKKLRERLLTPLR